MTGMTLLAFSLLAFRADSGVPIDLTTATGVIHGTLLTPATGNSWPMVLLIAGSGPTDRNGNSRMLPGKNNSLAQLAEGLATRGIATVRFDKRGIAASAAAMVAEKDLRFDNYIDDAVGWVKLLRSDRRFTTITIAGHSEGSLIGMNAAAIAGADGYVSLEGAGRPAATVLREQLRPSLPPDLWAESERIMTGLESGRTSDSVPAPLASLYHASVQPYLISWLRHDPARDIAALHIPVLVVQGTTDIQVSMTDAAALHAASPQSELLVVDGMNHVFKEVSSDRALQVASYSDPALPVAPKLLDSVGAFVKRVKRGSSR